MILGDLHDQISSSEAIKFYDNAILLDPENPEVLHAKAFHLQNHDKIQDALAMYRKINLISPQYGPAYSNAGILYMELDSLEKAFEQFNILAQNEPQNPVAYYYRAQTLLFQGDVDNAKTDLGNALNLDPDYLEANELLKEIIASEQNNG